MLLDEMKFGVVMFSHGRDTLPDQTGGPRVVWDRGRRT